MRTKFGAILASAALAAGLAVGATGVASATSADPEIFHVYGSCIVLTHNGAQYYVCVPEVSDLGGALVTTWEDGSALYGDGRVYDPEDAQFRDSAVTV